MMRLWQLVLLVLACTTMTTPARADELRPGYLELTQRSAQDWHLVWKAPVLGGLATRARPAFPPFCSLELGAAELSGAAVVAQGELHCTKALNGAEVGLSGIEASFTDALLRIQPLGRPIQAERLTQDRPVATVLTVPDRGQVARTYLLLGFEHILTGYDHLLLVVALVLLLMRGWVVVRAATAFTVAHSLTLAGTTLGFIGLAQAPVEALIALSIVFVAVEIVKLDPAQPRLSERIPWVVAFLFGLLHGFGFAGALREIGLPGGDVPMALLTFNVGVELGQLVIIAACLGTIALLSRLQPRLLRPTTLVASYAIGSVASFWFIQRLVG
ncbi:MAG TPA: HupE/UreJ family protein [Novosphingobium sp.]|nr:HupE/UreJ family protein [Novosphingobium sp.]